MFDRFDVLIAVALTYTLGCITYYDQTSGVLSLALGLAFTFSVLWLATRNRDESPEVRTLRAQVGDLAEQHAEIKTQIERLVLRGGR